MRRLLIILSSIGVALLLCTPAQAATGWSTPAMVWNGDYSQPSTVLDSHGALHLAARGDTGIWYLTNRTGSWTRVRLTTDGSNAYGAVSDTAPHIALDHSDGSLTIVYTRTVARDYTPEWTMRYVTNRSGSWSAPRRIPGDWAQSVAVRNGVITIVTPAVGYCCAGGFASANFVTNASGHWTTESLGGQSGDQLRVADSPSLALDSQGKPRLAYVKANHVMYARGTTKRGSFAKEIVASFNPNVGYVRVTSIALDALGRPRIVYVDGTGTNFAYRDTAGWHVHRVADPASDVRLTLDSQGRPCIVLATGAKGLWYEVKSGGAWHSVQLDTHKLRVLGGMAVYAGGRLTVVYQRGKVVPRIWYTSST